MLCSLQQKQLLPVKQGRQKMPLYSSLTGWPSVQSHIQAGPPDHGPAQVAFSNMSRELRVSACLPQISAFGLLICS